MHLGFTEEILMRRHLALAAAGDGLHHRLFRAPEEPDVVGQVGRADGRVALAVRPVAGGADGKLLLSLRRQRGVRARHGEAEYVVGDFSHLSFAAKHWAHWRHHAAAAVHDRGLDRFRVAAEKPILVAQIGETKAAAGIGAMALRAVGEEKALPDGARFRIVRHHCQILLSELVEDGAVLGCGLLGFGLVFAARAPAECAGKTAEPGIQHQIDQREHDGQVEHPHPPARKRIVVLGEVLVPGMAVQLRRAGRTRGALALEQPHVPAPEAVDKIAHRFSPVSLVAAVSSSKSFPLNGSLAASSKSCLRLRLYAQTTIPMKATKVTIMITTRRSLMSMAQNSYWTFFRAVPSTCR